MKKLITILSIFIITLLCSCNGTPIEVENPQKTTTLELQNLADNDTTLYKCVIIKNNLYLLNNKTKLVTKSVRNDSIDLNFLILLTFILFIIIIIFIILIN